MNAHALRQKEFGGPETMNWITVEVPVREAAALLLKGMTAQYLLRRAYRVGKIGTSILIFLTLGVLGIWTIVDLVMLVVDSFKDK
jgi:hypothetical protein